MKVLSYGAINPDLVHLVDRLPVPGDDLRSAGWRLTYGGKAANAAVALAAWGLTVRLTGLVIGTDPLGDALLAALTVPGLDLSALERDPAEPTRHCVVMIAPDGERTIVCSGYEHARWHRMTDVEWEGVEGLVVDAFADVAAVEVVADARRRGLPVVWIDAPPDHAHLADLVIWSHHEHGGDEARSLHAAVVLTSGAGQVEAWWDTEHLQVSPPAIEAVDTTGAGDVFAAACLRGLLQGDDPARILSWAAAAGAALSAKGRAAGMPGVGEIDARARTLGL